MDASEEMVQPRRFIWGGSSSSMYALDSFDAPPQLPSNGSRTDSTEWRDASDVVTADEDLHTVRHMWPLMLAVLFLGGVAFGVARLVKTFEIDPTYGNWSVAEYIDENVLQERCSAVDHPVAWRELKRKLVQCRRHEYYARPPPRRLPAVPRRESDRQDLCRLLGVPVGLHPCTLVTDASNRFITHVLWSFAEPLADGSLRQSLQFWDDTHVQDCILQLRMRCIKSMIAIGGASYRERFITLKDPANLARFKTSAIELVQKFDMDGIDIDDETANMLATGRNWTTNQAPTVLSYLQALREGLAAIQKADEPKYLISWDEFAYSWDTRRGAVVGCDNYDDDHGWHRCFEPRIEPLVDFVNVMFYNIYDPNGTWYAYTMHTTLPTAIAKAIPAKKIVLGVCSGMGCVEPAPPRGQDVYNAGNGSAYYGGTLETTVVRLTHAQGAMLWSGTIDILYENATALKRMGRAGNYGVKMPFRVPHTPMYSP
ncbi:Aste57867_18265 [Aphanomyces stellatus]|uniref:Aste57867_18265 protein n=1 Tax=Aphanomyces stellatus TaxID=120398 RepID=A0A485LB19_9STRA|nr:hypothetical protein As57867_018203 [Aphanomyces stellatus]VFT95002.1 Aste57867_18265 [Aphanomyces stellatus]